jgi:hypothetical protein
VKPPLVAFLAAAALPACAGPCQRVKADREAFLSRAERAAEPHLAIAVPLSQIDRLLAPELSRLPTLRVPMPELAGLSLGTLVLRAEAIHTRPAPPGRVGFSVDVGLSRGRTRALTVRVDAVVTPRIDVERREVLVALRGRDIESIRPTLGPGGAGPLVDLVWEELPPAARMLTSKRALEQLAREAAEELMAEAFAVLKRDILDDLGEIAQVELDLPELPLARVIVSTDARDLLLAVHTALPVQSGLSKPGRAGGPADLVSVRVAGAAAAELANWGMREGALPDRWTVEGEGRDDGPLVAALAWRGEKKPLLVHLWQLSGDCFHASLAATPQVRVAGGKLVVSTDDARIEHVEGSAKVRAGVWFSGLGRRSFAFVEEHTAELSLELAGRPVRATVRSAEASGSELRLGVALAPGDDRRR